MTVSLRDSAFDPLEALRRFEVSRLAPVRGRYGAAVSFIGTMRDFNDGETVTALTLEHYPGMTERELEKIEQEARERWDILDVLVVHRVGEIEPGEAIVLVAVWSVHRREAFEACRQIIEALKTRAPFWKKERLVRGGSRWVEQNTPSSQPLAET
jgi:molybdopterin synthase catalytic subunit